MPFDLFERLVGQVLHPRKFLLNYSGESTIYPELVPAIRLARSTGASVELVTALASAGDSLVDELGRSGLTRLTVSIHAADETPFAEIYRYGSLAAVRAKLARFLTAAHTVEHPPSVDLAFVAMLRNLDQLAGVAGLAREMAVRSITIFPVLRRDEIPVAFPELDRSGAPTRDFRDAVWRVVERVRAEQPGINLVLSNPSFTTEGQSPGETPIPYPGALPPGAAIYSCEQNPWETAHVLANGDVVPCEVHDHRPAGNIARQPLHEIWHGEIYARFREAYRSGAFPECRSCPWKMAHVPGEFRSEILGARGRSAQIGHGWHDPDGQPHVWTSQEAAATLQPRPRSAVIHVNGILPPGPDGWNRLDVSCNGNLVGSVINETRAMLTFGVDFRVEVSAAALWDIEFRTEHVYRAAGDQRDLGFALVMMSSQAALDPSRARRQRAALKPLLGVIATSDLLGRGVCRRLRFERAEQRLALPLTKGISVLIPERDNPRELAECLRGAESARRNCPEPFQVLVVVNGAGESQYTELRALYPDVDWLFHSRPLGFTSVVQEGLRHAIHDWVYLLNSDAVPEPDAFKEVACRRTPLTFSLASQIFLKDTTRFREETNRTRIFLEDGLATTHDIMPPESGTVEHFYAGGGASLFQAPLLRRMLRSRIYDPFYWEDVEWGWRARKLGYRSIFCTESIVRHQQRATIGRCYSAEMVEAVTERNRLLFQLRNFTSAGSLESVLEAIARAPREVAEFFVAPATLAAVACGRVWNHRAPVPDEEILDTGE
jgi:radical SAM protein with 4Fe4S-binding SPASM domain